MIATKLFVVLVCAGASSAYAPLGFSHQSVVHHGHGGHGEGALGGWAGAGAGGWGGLGGGYADNHVDYHDHHPEYKFEYGVKDTHTGDNKDAWESRHGDLVKGAYSLKESDGTTRVVEYTADKHNGFNAVVKRIGHAHHPQVYGKHYDGGYGAVGGGLGAGAAHGHYGHATSYNNVNQVHHGHGGHGGW